MEEQKFTIPQLSFEGFEILEALDDEITLNDHFFRYRGRSRANVKDDDTGEVKECKYDYNSVIFKDKIYGMQCVYSKSKKCFEVQIGYADQATSFMFVNKQLALEFQERILQWKIS